MTKNLYNLKTQLDGSYGIAKFTSGLEVESSYTVSISQCDCPQGERGKSCRHQRMLPLFLALNRVDTDFFLDFDTKTWHQPLAPSYEIEYHDFEVLKRERLKAATQGLEIIPKADPGVVQASPASADTTPQLSVSTSATKGEPPTEADVQRVASAPLVASIKRRRI